MLNGSEKMLELLAGLQGNPEDLDTTLQIKAGRMWLGPIPLGQAPRLQLR